MPQYYTLEEAAKVLNMPPDEFREKARKKEVRAFQDRGNWRFLAQQIDELARQRGAGSDPQLKLGEAGKQAAPPDDDLLAVDFNLDDDSVPIGKEKPSEKRSTKSGPKSPVKQASGDSDVRLVMDSNLDFQIDLDSGVKVESSGPKSGGPKSSGNRSSRKSKVVDSGPKLVDKPSDSDVKVPPSSLESDIRARPPTGSSKSKLKTPSDSDIRLQDLPSASGKRKSPEANIITEEIDLDAEEARSAAQQKPTPPRPKPQTRAANAPVLPTSSPFELSEHDLHLDEPAPPKTPKPGSKSGSKLKKEVDSSSDFELVPFDSSKSPIELGSGEIPLLSGDEEVSLGDLPMPNAGNSGINLQEPKDSGISLESGGSDELEFELTLDSAATPKPAAKQEPVEVEEDSSSEFELSLDDSSPSDNSDSEFELSLDDGSSETVGLETGESSDSEFELTLDDEGGLSVEDEDAKDIFEETNFDVPALEDESGSEAVALDEADTDLEGSDFEISLDEDSSTGDESESQVVALEGEEDADEAAATVARPRKTKSKTKVQAEPEEEEQEPEEFGDLEAEQEAEEEEEDEEEEVVAAGPAPAVEWGPLPAILLAPTVLVLFLVGIMGFELVQGMWGYHRPAKVSTPVIKAIARAFDELPKD
jgi:excisionase family DNA binding protein